MEVFMKKMPKVLFDEIFSYIFPFLNQNKHEYISYRNYKGCDAYDRKYKRVYINDYQIMNPKPLYFGLELSAILMKNGKHRYYITMPLLECEATEDDDNRSIDYFYYKYCSIYVGKDLVLACILLFSDKIEYNIEKDRIQWIS
jgi:hypothetical protein